MIVVIASPALQLGDPGRRGSASGRGVDVGRGAIDGGSLVQLVGKVGDDPAGDALLLALAEAGIGHSAILRDPSRATPVAARLPTERDADLFEGGELGEDPPATSGMAGPPIDAEDLELALRYLPDHRVVVVAEPLTVGGLASVVADCSYVGAELVLIVAQGTTATDLPSTATLLEAPDADPDGVFGRTVGRFAAALDQGRSGAAALAEATSGSGWLAVDD